MNVNVVVLGGNLTRDPELRHTPSGAVLCALGLAVNEREKVNGEWTDRANFFDITVFGNQAEACAQYLAKGRPVVVEGKLRWRQWEADDGTKRQKIEVIAFRVHFGAKSENGGGGRRTETDFDPGPEAGARDDFAAREENFAPATSTEGGDSFVPAAGAGGVDDDIPFHYLDFYEATGYGRVRDDQARRTSSQLRVR